MYRRPLHPLADDDPSVDAELVRRREDDEREAEIELLACGITSGSREDLTSHVKAEREAARMEIEPTSAYDLEGRVW
jgi:hypothetical protein